MSVKLLALAASYNAGSLNRQLLSIAVARAEKAGAVITQRDYTAYDAPIYRDEPKGSPLPAGAALLADDLIAHDGLLLAMPEYNWSIPGGLKNLIDWLSIDARLPLKNKTGLLLCASPSARGGVTGLQHLRTTLEVLRLWVYPQMVAIGGAHHQLSDGALSSKADQKHLDSSVDDFVRVTGVLAHAR